MALQGSGQISASQIANEFGYTNGSETRLGSYRTTNGQGNFPVSFGALQFNSIDAQTGGSVPTSGQIKFSDFYGTRLQQVVNFYGSGRGGNRLIAKDRYNSGGSNDVNVIGNYRTRPNNSSGTKVHIHVNQQIGSEKTRVEHCALRTGSWDSSTTLQVDVGGSGRISGGGGDGGTGAGGGGTPAAEGGGSGTSGLGVQYNPTTVNVASGGVITGGFGGGGGGGGAYDTDKEGARTASGGGGGGGAGIPAGAGGGVNANAGVNGGPGNAGTISEGGAGGPRANNDGEAISGEGGDGGEATQSAGTGVTGTGGEGSTYGGGPGGANGAAIRRNSGFTVNVTNNGSINGVQNATTVL